MDKNLGKKNKKRYQEIWDDFTNEKKRRKRNIFSKIIDVICYFFKATTIITYIIIAIIILIFFDIGISNMKSITDISVKKAIEPMYNIKVKIVNEQVDENGNGKYLLTLKNNEDIKFYAIKNYGNVNEDYSTRAHKYYFDKWKSDNKKYFTIEENINDDILAYATYIEMNDDDIEGATNKIIEFVNYCGENFRANWRIFIKIGEVQIYPYQDSDTTENEAMENAKILYNKYFDDKNNK